MRSTGLFDEVAQGDGNDGDGRVDAGESVELAIRFVIAGGRLRM